MSAEIENRIKLANLMIIGRSSCPYTRQAREYFERLKNEVRKKDVEGKIFSFQDISHLPKSDQDKLLMKRTGKKTVPAIFWNGVYKGGFDDACTPELERVWKIQFQSKK
jgi:glutaredoxin